MRKLTVTFSVALAHWAILVSACGAGDAPAASCDSDSCSDEGNADAAGPPCDSGVCSDGGNVDASGPPCDPGICPDGYACVLDVSAQKTNCQSSIVCTGAAPGSFAAVGGVTVTSWAEAQAACSNGTSGEGTSLDATPCGGFVFFSQGVVDTGSMAVFDATSGALVAIVTEGDQELSCAGRATFPATCPQTFTACVSSPDAGE